MLSKQDVIFFFLINHSPMSYSRNNVLYNSTTFCGNSLNSQYSAAVVIQDFYVLTQMIKVVVCCYSENE